MALRLSVGKEYRR